MDRFKFGDVILELSGDVSLASVERMERFRTEETGDNIIHIRCRMSDFQLPEGSIYIRTMDTTDYYLCGDSEICVYRSERKKDSSCVLMTFVIESSGDAELYIVPHIDPIYLNMHEVLKHIELISLLIRRKHWVLHSCYVGTSEGAILFSANSGVGKSTQGKLWEKYTDGRIINEDRCLLYEKDGRFYANGFVYSGSSKICLNESMPLRAIVLLKQGPENRVSGVRMGYAVRMLYMQLVCGPFRDPEKLQKMDFAEGLARGGQVLQLECRPDEEAVRVLEAYLRKNKL